jgi:hypothetical protein
MAKISTVDFMGKSGKSYGFNVYPFDQQFKAIGAVYIVSRRYMTANGRHSHKVIYVGQTDDLSIRFDDHHKANCFKQNDANCICTHVDDDEDSRLAKEDDLIKLQNPPCND